MKLLLVIMLALVPQLAAAKVYMCTDRETGETVFTDKACETAGIREEVRVNGTNYDSGRRAKGKRHHKVRKSWNSERETRKTGLDYNAERRAISERGTAQVD